jgi:hypothetical protein
MAAEEFAEFTAGIEDATDSLGDFTDALGEAGASALESGDLAGLGGGGEAEAESSAGVRSFANATAAAIKGDASSMRGIADTLLNIASAGLPPGPGTVVTKAIGSIL